jgi:hypothetical protein
VEAPLAANSRGAAGEASQTKGEGRRVAQGNRGRRLTGEAPRKAIKLAKRVSNFSRPRSNIQYRISKISWRFPR